MTDQADERLHEIGSFLTRQGLRVESLGLVSQSLIHRSYAFEHEEIPDNERLEFLGDAILGALAAEFLYREYPDEPEGLLSKKKAFLVSRLELARRGEELGLGDMVLLGRGEEHSGGRERASIVGSALEALIGALYFEIPYDELRAFVNRTVLSPASAHLRDNAYLDFKSRLQELVQKSSQTVPEYRKIREVGPAHNRSFLVEVYVDGKRCGAGEGQRIKTAENRAAKEAYEALLRQDSSH